MYSGIYRAMLATAPAMTDPIKAALEAGAAARARRLVARGVGRAWAECGSGCGGRGGGSAGTASNAKEYRDHQARSALGGCLSRTTSPPPWKPPRVVTMWGSLTRPRRRVNETGPAVT